MAENGPVVNASGKAGPSSRFMQLIVLLFMLSMVMPVWIRVGPLLLMPHRIILVILFIPLCVQVFTGRVGRVRVFDLLMLFSSLWAMLAISVSFNPRGDSNIQPMGIYMLETFGAYMMGRVAIRSKEDFARFTKIFFIVLLVLVPFAALEAVTHRAVMLELIPQSVAKTVTPDRWGMRRAQTVFAHPILFGVFSSIGFGLFWYVMRTHFMRVGGSLMSFAGTVFSLSSGALVSITVQGVFIIWEKVMKPIPKRWTIFAVLSVFFYIAIDLLSNRTPFHVLITYATFNTGTSYNRILIWRYGMENVWANPLFGLGENVDNWSRPYWMSSSADNYWLLLTMKYGIPCFLSLATALFLIIRRIATASVSDPTTLACRAGYLTALGGIVVAGGTAHYWHGVMAFVMFFFGAGVWIIDSRTRVQADAQGAESGDVLGTEPEALGSGGSLIYTRQPNRHRRLQPTRTARTGMGKVVPPLGRHGGR